MDLTDLPLVLRPEEAWRALRIGRGSFYEAVRSGRIRALRLGGRAIRVPRAEIARLLGEDSKHVQDEP